MVIKMKKIKVINKKMNLEIVKAFEEFSNIQRHRATMILLYKYKDKELIRKFYRNWLISDKFVLRTLLSCYQSVNEALEDKYLYPEDIYNIDKDCRTFNLNEALCDIRSDIEASIKMQKNHILSNLLILQELSIIADEPILTDDDISTIFSIPIQVVKNQKITKDNFCNNILDLIIEKRAEITHYKGYLDDTLSNYPFYWAFSI